ncbi:LysR family transcriptional regulator [Alicycliphilus denitrificans]|uniref:LysR family transcriptional regulator n=1 Tax=Alicycliphilus denitrificans TaxID=179636 RepID=A0A420KAK3_9BURK|nr:LysR family transcriptional regulator [Alicycliphilus denitrificans]
METRWIQDFVTLADVRNFTRAAELRNVSQAAFSRRIQALEQWLGTALVDRTCFPLRFTEAGERFRASAVALLAQIDDVRAEAAGENASNNVKLAMPYALAATRLSPWWDDWSRGLDARLSVSTGNVLDTMQALSEGSVDLVIGYFHAASPITPDLSRHEHLLLGTEKVRPYSVAASATDRSPRFALPDTADHPAPLLMYSPTVYFSRVVRSVLDAEGTPLHGHTAVESAMTDVLASMAEKGMGLAWLPDSCVAPGRFPSLVPAADARWCTHVDVVAFRLRHNTRPVVERVWSRMAAAA